MHFCGFSFIHYFIFLLSTWGNIILQHRHLQSCGSTWARLGYATFDVQLQKAYFVTTLYAIITLILCTVTV